MSNEQSNYLDEDGFRKEDHLELIKINKEKLELQKELKQINKEIKAVQEMK